jgi:hypothetical protein
MPSFVRQVSAALGRPILNDLAKRDQEVIDRAYPTATVGCRDGNGSSREICFSFLLWWFRVEVSNRTKHKE